MVVAPSSAVEKMGREVPTFFCHSFKDTHNQTVGRRRILKGHSERVIATTGVNEAPRQEEGIRTAWSPQTNEEHSKISW